ncbi:hypothetical protein OfM2_11380 [Lactovum odontotermitis]
MQTAPTSSTGDTAILSLGEEQQLQATIGAPIDTAKVPIAPADDSTRANQNIFSTNIQPRAPAPASASNVIDGIIKNSSVTDLNGNPIAGDVNQFTDIQLNFDFALPNGSVKAGDTTTIQLSPNIRFPKGQTFDVKDANGNIIATAVVDPDTKTLTMTYTDFVETHSDITGALHVAVRVDTTNQPTSGDLPISIKENGTDKQVGNLRYTRIGDSADEKFMKYGYISNDAGTQAEYVLRVNASGGTYTNVSLSDELQSAGVTYDTSSFQILKGTWVLNSSGFYELSNPQDVTSHFPINFTAGNTAYSVNFGDINGEGYRIFYRVNINHTPVNGEKFLNNAQLTGNNTVIGGRLSDVAFQSAGGEASGYNYNIRIHKTDDSNIPLSGAQFSVIRTSTGASVGTIITDSSGNGQLQNLLKDSYVLHEIEAPAGYALAADITISPEDFDSNNEVAKNVIDKKLESPKTSVSGQKTWIGDTLATRPTSITVNLLANGVVTDFRTVTADNNNNWQYTFGDLPKNDENGEPINYTVTEDQVNDYNTTYDGYNITNSYAPGKTSVGVTKSWNDQSDKDGLRPDKIYVQLYSDGIATGPLVELNSGNDWHTTWNDLAQRSGPKNIVYTVKEVSALGGYTSTTNASDPGNIIITNTHLPETTSVEGQKTWQDNDNQDGKRPASIKVNLLANGTIISTQETTAANGWKYAFDNLPKYENGQQINYTVTEDQVAGYNTVYTDGYNITNNYTPTQTSISVTKAWDDQYDKDGMRPASIKVQLFANGIESGAAVELNSGNNWRNTWNNLPEKVNGQTITYTVAEDGTSPGYTTTQDNSDPGNVIITNVHIPETTNVEGQKIWDDNNNQDGKRPASIRVNLLANGVIVDTQDVIQGTGETNSWKYAFSNLPKYENGKLIDYTVAEDHIDDYTTTYDGYNITNSHTPGETSVRVTKAWNDKDDQDGIRPASIQVQLYADGQAYNNPVDLTADTDWTAIWQNLPELSNGVAVVYTVEEIGTPSGYTITKNESNIGDIILTNSHEPDVTKVEGEKIWNDADNQDGKRPDSITITLLANGEIVDQKEVKAADNWKYSFENLPKNSRGKEIIYSVKENHVNDYTASYDGYNITNSYTPGKTSVSVTKAWNDKDNQDGSRPSSIQVQLYADGKALGDPVTLDDSNKWTKTWQDLAEKSAGKTVQYTVKEIGQVKGYTVTVNEEDIGNIVITNSHTPEIPNKPNKPVEPGKPNKPNSPDKPNKPVQPNQPNLPKTGEQKNISLALAGGSLLGISLLVYLKKRKS